LANEQEGFKSYFPVSRDQSLLNVLLFPSALSARLLIGVVGRLLVFFFRST